jgi:hypothetical protein
LQKSQLSCWANSVTNLKAPRFIFPQKSPEQMPFSNVTNLSNCRQIRQLEQAVTNLEKLQSSFSALTATVTNLKPTTAPVAILPNCTTTLSPTSSQIRKVPGRLSPTAECSRF